MSQNFIWSYITQVLLHHKKLAGDLSIYALCVLHMFHYNIMYKLKIF